MLLVCIGVRAQEAIYFDAEGQMQVDKEALDKERWEFSRKTDVLQVLYNGQWLQDSYLSPLVYDGWNAGLCNEWWTDFRKQRYTDLPGGWANWRHAGTLQAVGGQLTQSKKHNLITIVDIQAGWGAHPYWTFEVDKALKGIDASRFELFVGPYLDFDFMMKNISSNVNKPYSFDMGMDIELMAGGSYTFHYKKTAYRLLYEGRINALGTMWLPDYGESYYEVTEKVNLNGSFAFSHPGNRQFVHQQLAMDFQFKKSTWRLGIKHEYLHYGDKERHFARQSVGLTVGCIFNYYLLGTKL